MTQSNRSAACLLFSNDIAFSSVTAHKADTRGTNTFNRDWSYCGSRFGPCARRTYFIGASECFCHLQASGQNEPSDPGALLVLVSDLFRALPAMALSLRDASGSATSLRLLALNRRSVTSAHRSRLARNRRKTTSGVRSLWGGKQTSLARYEHFRF